MTLINSQNNLTEKTPENLSLTTQSPLCQTNCKTCHSPHLEEIHQKRLTDGLTLRELSDYLKKKYNEEISHSALHSHFRNFHNYVKTHVENRMIVYLNKEIDKRAEHSAKLVTLIDEMFDDIAIEWPQVPKTIENLERLIKIQIAVKNGSLPLGDFDAELRSLIHHANNVNFNQLSLFSPAPPIKPEPDNSEKKEV